jgi:hypothetical protein
MAHDQTPQAMRVLQWLVGRGRARLPRLQRCLCNGSTAAANDGPSVSTFAEDLAAELRGEQSPSPMQALVEAKLKFIMEHRERLLEAWIAETGIPPSEACLCTRDVVTDTTITTHAWIELAPKRAPLVPLTNESELARLNSEIMELESQRALVRARIYDAKVADVALRRARGESICTCNDSDFGWCDEHDVTNNNG